MYLSQGMSVIPHPHWSWPQFSSASRLTASQSGFFILIQSGDRPERYTERRSLLTMPSSFSLQACRKISSASPSRAICRNVTAAAPT